MRARRCVTAWRPLPIQSEETGNDLVIGQVAWPAVCRGDGLVETRVSGLEPSGPCIMERGERAAWIRAVAEPVGAQRVKVAAARATAVRSSSWARVNLPSGVPAAMEMEMSRNTSSGCSEIRTPSREVACRGIVPKSDGARVQHAEEPVVIGGRRR